MIHRALAPVKDLVVKILKMWTFEIIMDKMDAKGEIGCRKKSWLRNIQEWTGVASSAELFRRTRDKTG
ncbi:unnamed protein product [Arctia plantaginis]|uniref:Uncharacterized protein n=1 Tax=Arctia plantaginis TaxID=874455 RepID=A0A8S1ANT4_ARCPL|nr:unnamed protein product [Arctia plantaginis]